MIKTRSGMNMDTLEVSTVQSLFGMTTEVMEVHTVPILPGTVMHLPLPPLSTTMEIFTAILPLTPIISKDLILN